MKLPTILKPRTLNSLRCTWIMQTVLWLLHFVEAGQEYKWLRGPGREALRVFAEHYETLGLDWLLEGNFEPASCARKSARILRELHWLLANPSPPKVRSPPSGLLN